MLVTVTVDGFAMAQISAVDIAAAFIIWGALMGVTGAAGMWLLSGERRHDDDDDTRYYRPGRAERRRRSDDTVEQAVIEAVPARRGAGAAPVNARRPAHDTTTATIPRIPDKVITVTNMPVPPLRSDQQPRPRQARR